MSEGVLGVFDPTLLLNGQYRLRLTGFERSGAFLHTPETVAFTVEGNRKVGNFTLSFTDLEVPVAGIPMQVIRTYDSRDKNKGDFGVGWRLEVANVRLEESAPPGVGWRVAVRPRGFGIAEQCLQPTRSHVISITFGDGRVYRFEPVVEPSCQLQYAGGQVRFRPLFGTAGSLRELENAGEDFFVTQLGLGEVQITKDGTVWNPDLYELTLEDGRKLVIRQGVGLVSLTDLNGNRLSVDENGIHHSSGKDLTFVRDEQGRITRIVDPDGKVR